jgi:hypothetical protein
MTKPISSAANSLMREYSLPKKLKGAGKITALTTLNHLFFEGLMSLLLRRYGNHFF